ncbi:MAG: substrate-binding domain-containing protein [Desulfohalobiaceae bacterium]|nr:substrate-binding domain-containing protein [Desulfohalobiaceae bacterium]
MKLVFGLLILLLMTGVGSAAARSVMMATTTSTDNTGLLDYLAPAFEEDTGIELKWTAVGTGKALEMGKNCDVDVLLVHAPPAEKEYVENGYGVDRTRIMYNDFVLVGPADDPAGIKGKSVREALQAIKESKSQFFSRGDDSGTNKKELLLWDKAGVDLPEKAQWYLETGRGMISTLTMADERDGYTLTDRGTYIKYADTKGGEPKLKILVEGDSALFNQYSAMVVNPERCQKVKVDEAREFIEWMVAEDTQDMIGDFRLLGKKLFIPNAR